MNERNTKSLTWKVIIPYIVFFITLLCIMSYCFNSGDYSINFENILTSLLFSLFFSGFVYSIISAFLWRRKYYSSRVNNDSLIVKFLGQCLIGIIYVFMDIPLLIREIKILLGRN